jgi:hypothetical protein
MEEVTELAAVEVATEAGTETEIPAALQMPARAGATSVRRLVWCVKRVIMSIGDVLAKSSAEQREGTQDWSELVIAA